MPEVGVGSGAGPRQQAGCGQADGGRPGHDRRSPVPSEPIDPADHRQLRDPRTESDDAPEASHRDVEKRADDDRVELRSRALDQLLAGRGHADRLAVRAHRGHHLIGVGHRDDASRERDLRRRQVRAGSRGRRSARGDAARRPPTRPSHALSGPMSRAPSSGWRRTLSISALVSFAGFERISVGTTSLPMSWSSDAQRRRARSRGGELHLVGDEVGEHANTLRVAAGLPVVDAERRDELEHHLHVRDLATGRPPCRALPAAGAAGRAACRRGARRRSVSARGRGRATTG